ncbi:MAG: hypothetical protein J6S53_05370 [Lentisphaeria bacterium]|nr:hypothetical protein [Lentisphaeria bacterium]
MKYFWYYYFFIRSFYYLFTLFFVGDITQLGDNARYLAANKFRVVLTGDVSTSIVDSIGYLFSIFKFPVLQNFSFFLFSFLIIKWAVEELQLKNKINNLFLLLLLSTPSFCIWTSVLGKEVFGLFASAVIGVLFANFFVGDFKVSFRDMLAFVILLIFKKHYMPFIFEGLFLIWLYHKFKLNNAMTFMIGFVIIVSQLVLLYYIQETVDYFAMQMYEHFAGGNSTRDNIFVEEGDFFRYLPYSMFIAFWGPTVSEMKNSPLHFLTACESLLILFATIKLLTPFLLMSFTNCKKYCLYLMVLFITVGGILFIHAPFGVFNPGSAIRYRTNFIFLFLLLFMQFYIYFKDTSLIHSPILSNKH